MKAELYDDTACELGEGPLWHPERHQLFWFDILGRKLLTREGGKTRHWQFDEMVSAAGWIDAERLLIASETRLLDFDLGTGDATTVCPLEADAPATRSNDGRADPWGGFWIGTMGKAAEPGAGAIYRFCKGTLRRIAAPITIPNAICFAHDRSAAFYTDTPTRIVLRQPLDADGWPDGPAEPYLDFNDAGLNPDGAVVDAEGVLWCAQWGASRVAGYAPDGTVAGVVEVPARHSSCPAFGGDDLGTMFVTTAREHLDAATLAAEPMNGMTFAAGGVAAGVPEYRVVL